MTPLVGRDEQAQHRYQITGRAARRRWIGMEFEQQGRNEHEHHRPSGGHRCFPLPILAGATPRLYATATPCLRVNGRMCHEWTRDSPILSGLWRVHPRADTDFRLHHIHLNRPIGTTMTVVSLPDTGWLTQTPVAGWLLHDRDGLAPTAECGTSLCGAWQCNPIQAIAHMVALCPKCFVSEQTASRP
jgi:hypothetical protein